MVKSLSVPIQNLGFRRYFGLTFRRAEFSAGDGGYDLFRVGCLGVNS
jgi:hypothetical protein